jgi:hypothetical protein
MAKEESGAIHSWNNSSYLIQLGIGVMKKTFLSPTENKNVQIWGNLRGYFRNYNYNG